MRTNGPKLSLIGHQDYGVIPIGAERLKVAKQSFATRRFDPRKAKTLIVERQPKAGDLVLAEVSAIGHHTKLESPQGRRRSLFPGDEIIVVYGARYASDQLDAVVPNSLGPCALVAGGGLAGRVLRRHGRTRQPTRLAPIGLLGDAEGNPFNLSDFALPPAAKSAAKRPITIAVVGTAMNAGKTSAVAALVRGLAAAGLRVGAAKVTGTGSGNDLWLMVDSGARQAIDFTDVGFPSTHLIGQSALTQVATALLDHLAAGAHDFAIIEIADGLLMPDTAYLLQSPELRSRIDGVIFAAGDSMGAVAGVEWLNKNQLPVLAFTGVVTASPLATEEAARTTGLPSAALDELSHPEFAPQLCLGSARARNLA